MSPFDGISKEVVETAGKHAATATGVIGLFILIFKPFIKWRQNRKARKTMILDKLDEINRKQDTLQNQLLKDSEENRLMHEAINTEVNQMGKHTRLIVTATIAVIDALMQHDEDINGIVAEFRKKLQEAIVDGI